MAKKKVIGEEMVYKSILSLLEDIKDRLSAGSIHAFRGPVADPGPEWGYRFGLPEMRMLRGPVADPGPEWGSGLSAAAMRGFIRGPVADPGPGQLLDRARIAKLKINRLDIMVEGLEKEIASLKLERDLLKEEYDIK